MAGAASEAPHVLFTVRTDHLNCKELGPVVLGERPQLAAQVGVGDHFDHDWPAGPERDPNGANEPTVRPLLEPSPAPAAQLGGQTVKPGE